jgi:hypothetical protein
MKISETIAAAVGFAFAPTSASAANDPRVAELFRELFLVVFPDSHALKPNVGDGNRQ